MGDKPLPAQRWDWAAELLLAHCPVAGGQARSRTPGWGDTGLCPFPPGTAIPARGRGAVGGGGYWKTEFSSPPHPIPRAQASPHLPGSCQSCSLLGPQGSMPTRPGTEWVLSKCGLAEWASPCPPPSFCLSESPAPCLFLPSAVFHVPLSSAPCPRFLARSLRLHSGLSVCLSGSPSRTLSPSPPASARALHP